MLIKREGGGGGGSQNSRKGSLQLGTGKIPWKMAN